MSAPSDQLITDTVVFLQELADWLDGQEDCEIIDGNYHPNAAMKLRIEADTLILRLTKP